MTRSTSFPLAALLLALGLSPAVARAQDETPKPTDERKDAPPPADGGDRGGRGGGRRFGLPIDELKAELNLSDEQVQKLEGINQHMVEEFKKARDEMQKDGDFDWTKAREKMKEGRDRVREKIRGILTDEQKPKFDELVKKQDANGPGGGGGRDPEKRKKRLYEDASKELNLSPDERAAVMPLVQKVIDARADARTQGDKRREEFKAFARKATGGSDAEKAAIAAKLAEYRKAAEDDQKKVKEAQAAVREVLTIDNEAKLVALGILD